MAIDPVNINENIRWYKPNDPYYYEVDNLPLIDLLNNSKLLRDKINELVSDNTNYATQDYVQTHLQNAIGDPAIVDIDGDGDSPQYTDIISWVIGQGYLSEVTTSLSDLSDVNIPSPSDGDTLTYDANASKWVPGIPNISSTYQKLTLFMEKSISDGGFTMKTIFSENHDWTTRNLTSLNISVPDNTKFLYVKVRASCNGSVTGTQYARIANGYPELTILNNVASSAAGTTGYNGSFLYLPLLKTTDNNGIVTFSFQTKSSNFDHTTKMWAVGYVTEQ